MSQTFTYNTKLFNRYVTWTGAYRYFMNRARLCKGKSYLSKVMRQNGLAFLENAKPNPVTHPRKSLAALQINKIVCSKN